MILNLLFLLLFLPFCISIESITRNQSLTDGLVLISKESSFALGFFCPGNSISKYVGIWYHKLPGKTVVWVANRDNPINDSSGILSVSSDGNIVLYTSHNKQFPIWSTNVSLQETGACVAYLLDSGNLVLVHNETKRIVWQSFDHPTDTLLPGMKIGLDRKKSLNWFLTSWRSVNDPGIGNYSFKVNPGGSPQLFLYKGGLIPYWRSSPWPWRSSALLVPNYIYKYSLVNTEDAVYYTDIVDDKSTIKRKVIDSSGLLRLLIWDNGLGRWKQPWSVSKEIYGHCGAYAVFTANNVAFAPFECSCLPGYKPRSLKDWDLRDGSAGCTRKRKFSMCRNGEGFVRVDHVKIPDTSIAALMNKSLSRAECEQLCLRNCSCKAFASLDIDRKRVGCLMWHGQLMDTTEHTEGKDFYIRVDAIELAKYAKRRGGFLKRKGMVVIPVLSAVLNMFLLIIVANIWLRKRRKRKVKKKLSEGLLSSLVADELVEITQPSDMPFFDLQTISAATNNFNTANKLGQGGFGSVYKGLLHDGRQIAVKRLSPSSGQGTEEFKNELLLLARLQHRNLVKLLGCCIQEEEQMLIYEYLPNKSLDYFIFDERRKTVLDWRKRFEIIVGLARGILYLQHDSRLRIIHRDLKTSNVLLDAEMNPKISDFGTARIFEGDEVQVKTKRVVGTYGYMAPEYVVFGKFSTKSDVFSFGVILLEIICGKKSNTSFPDDPSMNLIGHVWDLWQGNRATDIVDSMLMSTALASQLFRCIQIGLLCVQEYATDRPTMPTVVLMLNSENTLPVPKQPAFAFGRATNDPTLSTLNGHGSVNELTITEVEAR